MLLVPPSGLLFFLFHFVSLKKNSFRFVAAAAAATTTKTIARSPFSFCLVGKWNSTHQQQQQQQQQQPLLYSLLSTLFPFSPSSARQPLSSKHHSFDNIRNGVIYLSSLLFSYSLLSSLFFRFATQRNAMHT